MELEKKIALVSVDTFMAEFVPGDDLDPGRPVEAFDPAGFNRQEQFMYDELVNGCSGSYDPGERS